MKHLLISLLLFANYGLHGQVNLKRLSNEICPCFDKAKGTDIKKCISNKDITIPTQDPSDYIEFLKVFGSNCELFSEFLVKQHLNGSDLSDEEYTKIVYYLMTYFGTTSTYGTLPKRFIISPMEVGLRYNTILSTTSKDTVYLPGTHYINSTDSMLIFDVGFSTIDESFQALLKSNEMIDVKVKFGYSLIGEKFNEIYALYGKQYKDRYLIPEFRSILRQGFSEYNSENLIGKKYEDISIGLADNLEANNFFKTHFRIQYLKIESIIFSSILEKAKTANLLDEYYNLNNQDKSVRFNTIKALFNNRSDVAILLVLNHWQNEEDENIRDFIIGEIKGN